MLSDRWTSRYTWPAYFSCASDVFTTPRTTSGAIAATSSVLYLAGPAISTEIPPRGFTRRPLASPCGTPSHVSKSPPATHSTRVSNASGSTYSVDTRQGRDSTHGGGIRHVMSFNMDL